MSEPRGGWPIEEIAEALLGEPNRELSSRRQWRYGRNGSLAIELAGDKRGEWFDHETGVGGGPLELVRREVGGANGEALDWLRRQGVEIGNEPTKREVAAYAYRDETGAVLFEVVRFEPKTFRQRRPDGTWSVKGLRQVPYRLPELLERPEGAPVFVVEGEKDADELRRLGVTATCNAGGAGKWPEALNEYFANADVVILPDNDEPGRAHAAKVARSLRDVAASVRIVELPGLPPKGDASDWIDAGGSIEDLQALVERAPAWEPEAADPLLALYSDETLTLAFTERHADELRYCDKFGAWFRWQGGCWREDVVRGVFSMARQLCRDKAGEVLARGERGADRIATQVGSARTVAAVVGLARADPRHATAPADWDADAWALNTPAGIVDLQSGKLRPHDRAALCSKITKVAPEKGDCPLWRRFLAQITAGDEELQRFLRRVAGYSLTGCTREHAMFFLFGVGANGKGTFLNTLTALLGDYAAVASMETFTDSKTDRHPTDLAMLRGARLVAAQETDEGRGWAESRIKALTGGDPITARFMRQDFFTYTPQFKLLIAGNHKPHLRNLDEAIRRRLHLLPFDVVIPRAERDKQLADKLKAEWPAILAWAIRGCLEWQEQGLDPPAAVVEATGEYFDDEDALGRWLAECCRTDDYFAHELTADLYRSWKAWADRAGLAVGTETSFRNNLKARGLQPKRSNDNRSGFQGISLNRRNYTDDPRSGS